MKNSKQLKWRRRLLGCTFQLFSGEKQIGHLKDSELSRSATGEINGQHFKFVTVGHFHPKTHIVDPVSNTKIGQIKYNSWYPKAQIMHNGATTTWKFSNIWETRWKLFNQEDQRMSFKGHTTKGSIQTSELDNLLILAGLYVSNYYWRLSAIIIASLSPILIFAV